MYIERERGSLLPIKKPMFRVNGLMPSKMDKFSVVFATILFFCSYSSCIDGDYPFAYLYYLQVFLPYPYSRSTKVQWRVFEKLFTDFRDCFSHVDYYDVLACAKNKFQPIPSAWLGY
jgi:hypothetical protein